MIQVVQLWLYSYNLLYLLLGGRRAELLTLPVRPLRGVGGLIYWGANFLEIIQNIFNYNDLQYTSLLAPSQLVLSEHSHLPYVIVWGVETDQSQQCMTECAVSSTLRCRSVPSWLFKLEEVCIYIMIFTFRVVRLYYIRSSRSSNVYLFYLILLLCNF